MGTFTYCLVVIRAVRLAEGENQLEEAVVPNVSVAVAMLLGVVSILATVAFIDHTAHTLDISEILRRVYKDTKLVIERTYEITDKQESGLDKQESGLDEQGLNNLDAKSDNAELPDNEGQVIHFRTSGWVQEMNIEALVCLVPDNGYIKMKTTPGRYALNDSVVCVVGNLETDGDLDEFNTQILDALAIGRYRTIRDDPSFGLRQIVDVTLKALSPGVNDPTTAQEGIFNAAALVVEFLKRDPPPSVIKTPNGGRLILAEQPTHDDIVKLAYNEVRVCAASSPTVCLYLMESLRLIRESLTSLGLEDRAPEIEKQVQLIEANCSLVSTHTPFDQGCVAEGRVQRFPALCPLSAYKTALQQPATSNAHCQK